MAAAWRGDGSLDIPTARRTSLKRTLNAKGVTTDSDGYRVDLAVDICRTVEESEITRWLQSNSELAPDELKDSTLGLVQSFFGVAREKAFFMCQKNDWDYETVVMKGMEMLGDGSSVDSLWDSLSDEDRGQILMESQIFDATLQSLKDQRRAEYDSFKALIASTREMSLSGHKSRKSEDRVSFGEGGVPPPPPPPPPGFPSGSSAPPFMSSAPPIGASAPPAYHPPPSASGSFFQAEGARSSDFMTSKDLDSFLATSADATESEERALIMQKMNELKAELKSMGFLNEQIERGMEAVPVFDFSTAKREIIQWILRNPLSREASHAAKMAELKRNGFNEEECESALRSNHDSFTRALEWLNHGKPLCLNFYMHNMASEMTLCAMENHEDAHSSSLSSSLKPSMMKLSEVSNQSLIEWDITNKNEVYSFAQKGYLIPDCWTEGRSSASLLKKRGAPSAPMRVTEKTIDQGTIVPIRCLTEDEIREQRIPKSYRVWYLSRGSSKVKSHKKSSHRGVGDYYTGPCVLRHGETFAYLSYNPTANMLYLSKEYNAQCVVFLSKYDFLPIAREISDDFKLSEDVIIDAPIDLEKPGKSTTFVDEVETECVICYENEPNVVLKPCGHQDFCYSCMADDSGNPMFEECPICRGSIAKVIKTDS